MQHQTFSSVMSTKPSRIIDGGAAALDLAWIAQTQSPESVRQKAVSLANFVHSDFRGCSDNPRRQTCKDPSIVKGRALKQAGETTTLAAHVLFLSFLLLAAPGLSRGMGPAPARLTR